MYVEDIQQVGDVYKVVYVGPSIDEEKVLNSVALEFGKGDYEIVGLDTDENGEELIQYCYVQLKGDNMTETAGEAVTANDLAELEKAQIAQANGGVAPTAEVLPPVARVKATDADVERVVETADVELEQSRLAKTYKVEDAVERKREKKATKHTKAVKEKKEKKIDIARKIFASNTKQTRKVVIGKIMEKTGLSPVAAATYYQICKRES